MHLHNAGTKMLRKRTLGMNGYAPQSHEILINGERNNTSCRTVQIKVDIRPWVRSLSSTTMQNQAIFCYALIIQL